MLLPMYRIFITLRNLDYSIKTRKGSETKSMFFLSESHVGLHITITWGVFITQENLDPNSCQENQNLWRGHQGLHFLKMHLHLMCSY